MVRNSVFFVVFCIFIIIKNNCFEARIIRNTRQRSSLKPSPRLPADLEDSYGSTITKGPFFIEGGNQWKPLHDYTGSPIRSTHQKLRSKPSQKYSQQIYAPEYITGKQQYSNFITNQSLLVADENDSSIRANKPINSSSKKLKHHRNISNKKQTESYIISPQYQVYEEEDANSSPHLFTSASHNKYRNQGHDVVIGKPKIITSKPIISSARYLGSNNNNKEKHIHYMHFHDSDEDLLAELNQQHKIRRPTTYENIRRPSNSYSTRKLEKQPTIKTRQIIYAPTKAEENDESFEYVEDGEQEDKYPASSYSSHSRYRRSLINPEDDSNLNN